MQRTRLVKVERKKCAECDRLRQEAEAAWAAHMRAPRSEWAATQRAYKLAANAERTHWNECWPQSRAWRGRPYKLFPVEGS